MLGIATKIKILFYQIRWRKKYEDINGLIPKTLFPFTTVVPGINAYGELNIVSFNWKSKVYIGNYVSIAQRVTFLIDADHYTDHISSYPFKAKIIDPHENEAISKGNIIVSDDVWIGYGTTILSGVHIGQGAVVAAGSVVTKDVPPYAIVGGVPAKVIKYRFEQPVIDYMLTLDYGALSKDLIREHVDDLYTGIDGMELEEVKKLFAWFPKKSQVEME